MSAWSLLRDPRLFAGPRAGLGAGAAEWEDELARAREWLDWSAGYTGRGETLRRTKLHLFKRLAATLAGRPELREHLSLVDTREQLADYLAMVEQNLRRPDQPLPALPKKEAKPQEDTTDDCWILFEED